MSVILADIDATCASLGYNDGTRYHVESDSLQGLKVRFYFPHSHFLWLNKKKMINDFFLSYFPAHYMDFKKRRWNSWVPSSFGKGKCFRNWFIADAHQLLQWSRNIWCSLKVKNKKKTCWISNKKKIISRLLINLTSPALLLYREGLPKDAPSRRNFLQLIEILQGYKAAFTLPAVWEALGSRLQKALEIVSFLLIFLFFLFILSTDQS